MFVKLKDDVDELAGQQCYASGSLQRDYMKKGLRKHPGEIFKLEIESNKSIFK